MICCCVTDIQIRFNLFHSLLTIVFVVLNALAIFSTFYGSSKRDSSPEPQSGLYCEIQAVNSTPDTAGLTPLLKNLLCFMCLIRGQVKCNSCRSTATGALKSVCPIKILMSSVIFLIYSVTLVSVWNPDNCSRGTFVPFAPDR